MLCERFQGFWNLVQPAFDKRKEAQDAGLQVDHTAAGHCGRRCHGQVLDLKHHRHHLQEGGTRLNYSLDTRRDIEKFQVKLTSLSLMISPELRHSFLLSSSTVFMFSIHTASTGPSNMYHFFFLSIDDAPPRIRDERIPSVLSGLEEKAKCV